MSTLPTIDWSKHHRYSEYTIECRCGAVYRSHNKLVPYEGELVAFTEKPCPGCGLSHGHVRAARSDPESWSIQG
jgi:hypothetical protein